MRCQIRHRANGDAKKRLQSVGEVGLTLAQTSVLGSSARASASVGSTHAARAGRARGDLVLSSSTGAVAVLGRLGTARAAGLRGANADAVVVVLSAAGHC